MLTRPKVSDQVLKLLNKEISLLAAIGGRGGEKHTLKPHKIQRIYLETIVSKLSLKFRIYEPGYKQVRSSLIVNLLKKILN